MSGTTVKIGGIEAAPGTKSSGFLPVTDLYGVGLQMPLMIINGSSDGPTLAVTAGLHGCEYAGIEACIRLYSGVDPKSLKGTMLLVPVANVPGFMGRYAYINPIDQLDIDVLFDGGSPTPHSARTGRVFGIQTATLTYPYGIKGSVSELLADTLFKHVVSAAKYIIDFHGGDLPEETVDSVMVSKTGKEEVDQISESLARCFSARYIWRGSATPTGGGLVGKANREGIAGVSVKAGHSGRAQEPSVELLYEGTLSALRHLMMLEGSARMTQPQEIKAKHSIKANYSGIYGPRKNTGDFVRKGEVVGAVRNLFGKTVEELRAPADGLLFLQQYNPSVIPGDLVWILGEV